MGAPAAEFIRAARVCCDDEDVRTELEERDLLGRRAEVVVESRAYGDGRGWRWCRERRNWKMGVPVGLWG